MNQMADKNDFNITKGEDLGVYTYTGDSGTSRAENAVLLLSDVLRSVTGSGFDFDFELWGEEKRAEILTQDTCVENLPTANPNADADPDAHANADADADTRMNAGIDAD